MSHSIVAATLLFAISVGGQRRLLPSMCKCTRLVLTPSFGGRYSSLLCASPSSVSDVMLHTMEGSTAMPFWLMDSEVRPVKCIKNMGRFWILFLSRLMSVRFDKCAKSLGSSAMVLPAKLNSVRPVKSMTSTGMAASPMSTRSSTPLRSASSYLRITSRTYHQHTQHISSP